MSCPSGKVSYPTRGEAFEAIKRMSRRHLLNRTPGGKIQVYPCTAGGNGGCDGFHIGHWKPEPRKGEGRVR